MTRLLTPRNSNPNSLPPPIEQCLSLLHSSSSSSHLHQIHAKILTSGLSHHQPLTTKLIKTLFSLSPSHNSDYSDSLLFQTPNPSLSSFNHTIRNYSHNASSSEKALEIFVRMRRRIGIAPNELTYPFVLRSCAQASALQFGRQLHADCIKTGFDSVVYVRNTLILLYGNCRDFDDARNLFDEMPARTLVSWNTILNASPPDQALGLFRRMASARFGPDRTTFVAVLSAAAETGGLRFGKCIHGLVVARGVFVNVQLGTAMINMYAKCGELGFAAGVFEGMAEKNVWTWSAMILGLAQHGSAREALELFAEMKRSSVDPNHVTFLGVLCACSHAGLVDEGCRFFHEMVRVHGVKPTLTHYGAMVDVLARKGHLLEAYNYVSRMPVEPDAVVWRTLLGACQLHAAKDVRGVGDRAKRRLLDLEPRRSGNYVMVANMCSDVGSWGEAANARRIMREEGLKKPAGESCVEVGGSICRFISGDDPYNGNENMYQTLDGLNLNMKIAGYEDASCRLL